MKLQLDELKSEQGSKGNTLTDILYKRIKRISVTTQILKAEAQAVESYESSKMSVPS